MRKIDLLQVENKIVSEIKNFVGDKNVFLGISGGIDSAVTAYLCVKALGVEKVFGVLMPYGQQIDINDSLTVVNSLHIKYFEKDIKPIVDLYQISDNSYVVANIKSRTRMTVLYAYANSHNGLVFGTTNKSEYAIGYFTKHGDGGCDFEPIIDLYKSEIFQLAQHLGVPQSIINKEPSAGLAPGQTDEKDFGFTYVDLDNFLSGGRVSSNVEQKINKLIVSSEHKRHLPLTISISSNEK